MCNICMVGPGTVVYENLLEGKNHMDLENSGIITHTGGLLDTGSYKSIIHYRCLSNRPLFLLLHADHDPKHTDDPPPG